MPGKVSLSNSSIKQIRHPSVFTHGLSLILFTLRRSLSLVNWALDGASIHTRYRAVAGAQTPAARAVSTSQFLSISPSLSRYIIYALSFSFPPSPPVCRFCVPLAVQVRCQCQWKCYESDSVATESKLVPRCSFTLPLCLVHSDLITGFVAARRAREKVRRLPTEIVAPGCWCLHDAWLCWKLCI